MFSTINNIVNRCTLVAYGHYVASSFFLPRVYPTMLKMKIFERVKMSAQHLAIPTYTVIISHNLYSL